MTAKLLEGVEDAMAQLGVGRTKFYELVSRGEIEVVKIDRRTLVVMTTLEAYVDRLRDRADTTRRDAATTT